MSTLTDEGWADLLLAELSQAAEPPIQVHRRLPSTQSHLWQVAGPEGPTVVVAVEQSAGQGRRQRAWSSPLGGLWLSLAYQAPRLEGLPLLAGLAVVRVLQHYGLEPWMRWPNDVMVGSGKMAGILVDARGSLAVIGIGLNVAVPPTAWPPELQSVAVSMTDQGLPRPHLGKLLLDLLRIWEELARIHQVSGLSAFHQELQALVVGPGREVRIWEGANQSQDRMVSLGPDGSLALASGRRLYSVDRLVVL